MSKYVNQEIDPDHVWINISKGEIVRAAVLVSTLTEPGHSDVSMGVYKLERETISAVKEMIRCAKEGRNIRFYILEEVKEEDNNVTG